MMMNIMLRVLDFRSSNVRAVDVSFNLYFFDIRYQKNFTNSQPIKVEFMFDGVVPNDINRHALVLTNKLVAISSDGQRNFDLIYVIFNFFITSLFSFIVKSVFFSNDFLYLSGNLSMR